MKLPHKTPEQHPLPVFPFLFAIYPIWALLGRNAGELHPSMAIRFSIIFSLLALASIGAMYAITRDRLRALLLGTFLVWLLDSSGQAYGPLVQAGKQPGVPWFHIAVILIYLLIIVFLAQRSVWQRLKPGQWGDKFVRFLNLVSGISLVVAIVPIVQFWAVAFDDTPESWKDSFSPRGISIPKATSSSPDIYYIILDGYGRQDVLREVYGFDNQEFISFLRSRGFFVADMATSNYVQTPLSLSSSLNFDYINFAEAYAGKNSTNRLPLFSLLRDNRTRVLLEGAGYHTVATSSGYPFTEFIDVDTYLSPYLHSLNELERFYLSTTALDPFVSTNTVAGSRLRYYLPIPGYETSRQRILYSLSELKRIPGLESPKFVFVHIVGPHPPFVLDRVGNAVYPDRSYLPGDGEAFGGTPEEYQQQYVEQMIFINHEIEDAIDAILGQSLQPPVIIIQGDHGPGSLLIRNSLNETCLWERTSILNAYYLPNGAYQLSPGASPVNTFRILFNEYFGASLDLLPNRVYFSPQSLPYNFTDVTREIEPFCKD